MVAGPIVRYTDIAYDINHRRECFDGFYDGMCRFITGLSKKILIADILAVPVGEIFTLSPNSLSLGLSWMGALMYTLEIYFDFSGYSDMAIGMAEIFGFHFNENFKIPYASKNVTEFWRKWHISLSSFFRDYVYIPLGGNRAGKLKTYRNLGIVFLLCGLWYGSAWTFIVWGLYHGFFLIIEKILMDKFCFKMKGFLGNIVTFLIIMIGWVLFNSKTIKNAWLYLTAMFGVNRISGFQYFNFGYYITPLIWFTVIVGFILAIYSPKEQMGGGQWSSDLKIKKGIICIFLLALSMIYMSDASFNAFIYFAF